jgi:hypothetical protein
MVKKNIYLIFCIKSSLLILNQTIQINKHDTLCSCEHEKSQIGNDGVDGGL